MSVRAHDDFGADDYATALRASNAYGRPLSLHLHLPLCRQHERRRIAAGGMDPFEVNLSRLDREMVLVRRCLSAGRRIQALHWGGRVPPWMSLTQMSELIDRLEARFTLEAGRDRDFSVALDPRETDVFTLRHLEALGFNRLSLVAHAPQAENAEDLRSLQAHTEPLLDEAARVGWRSWGLVLVVGPWGCSPDTVTGALTTIIAMAPLRITLCPKVPFLATNRRSVLAAADALLAAADYRTLGRGVYARRGAALKDALAQAGRETTHDRLGFGAGAMSRLPDAEARNATNPLAYAAALDAGRLATVSGRWRRGDGCRWLSDTDTP